MKQLEDRELRYRETKITMDIKEIFLKPINVFIDDIDKFKEKELIKKSPFAKSTWLINYIPKSIKNSGWY